LSKIFKASGIQMDTQTKTIEIPCFVKTDGGKMIAGNAQGREEVDVLSRVRSEHVRILDQAEAEAARMIREAAVGVEVMRRDAEAEREHLRAEVRETAWKQGYDEGFRDGDAERNRIVAEAERLQAETLAECERAYAAIEPDMVALTLGITRKLLGDAVAINPQVVLNLIRQGLAEATLTGTLTLRVSKDEYEIVAADKEQLVAMADGAHIEIVRDVSLAKSDCIIETAYGNIDCSLDRQYESFAQNMRYIMNAAKPETDSDSNN